MIFGNIDQPSTYLPLANLAVWKEAFAVLSQLTPNSKQGITEIRGDAMFLNVHSYETKIPLNCRFEAHRYMVDVQFMIAGGEVIEWALKEDLIADGTYCADKDFQYFHRPATTPLTRIHLLPRRFGIFFPEDGHCPKINDGVNGSVLKAVVKIHQSLIGGSTIMPS